MAKTASRAQTKVEAAPLEQELPGAAPRALTEEERVMHVDNETSIDEIRKQVAVAAYYLAEQRGFAPGSELDDWLAAEAQIRARERASAAPN